MNNFNSPAPKQGHEGQTGRDEGSIRKATNRQRDGGQRGDGGNVGRTEERGVQGEGERRDKRGHRRDSFASYTCK